jgi:hypothetical protein
MVIVVVDKISVTINKFEEDTPIAGYFYRMEALFIAAQPVEERTRVMHIFYFACGIQAIKYSFKPIGMFGLDAPLAAGIEKVLQAIMFKGFNHSSCNVTSKVTNVNC